MKKVQKVFFDPRFVLLHLGGDGPVGVLLFNRQLTGSILSAHSLASLDALRLPGLSLSLHLELVEPYLLLAGAHLSQSFFSEGHSYSTRDWLMT